MSSTDTAEFRAAVEEAVRKATHPTWPCRVPTCGRLADNGPCCERHEPYGDVDDASIAAAVAGERMGLPWGIRGNILAVGFTLDEAVNLPLESLFDRFDAFHKIGDHSPATVSVMCERRQGSAREFWWEQRPFPRRNPHLKRPLAPWEKAERETAAEAERRANERRKTESRLLRAQAEARAAEQRAEQLARRIQEIDDADRT